MARKGEKILRIAAAVLAALFIVLLGTDALRYRSTLYSAPFWVFALARAVECLLPAALCAAAAWPPRLCRCPSTSGPDIRSQI